MEKLVSLCQRRGFIFPSSDIYGGLSGCWDYGPVGVELKRNVKDAWWRSIVQERDDMVGLDTSILMNPKVWEASGHVTSFSDPLVECKNCHLRWKADDLTENKCPSCGGELTEERMFNTMFKTFIGPVEEEAAVVYLRPETAQGMFVNFQNVAQHQPQAPALRHRPAGQGFPQRDYHRQLHLPQPRVRNHGVRVLRQAGHGREMVRLLGGRAP